MKENFVYMIKNWVAWNRKSLIYFFIKVPAMVLQPIITAYIPKSMIDCINDGVTVGRLALTVALLSVAVVLATWLTPLYAGASAGQCEDYPYAVCRYGVQEKP